MARRPLRRWLAPACTCSVLIAGGCRSASVNAGISIQAQEYAFVGAPPMLAPGEHTFTLRNIGKLDHEMVVVRLPSGGTLDQILAAPPYQAQAAVTVIGRASAKPGQKGDRPVTAVLGPGTYVMWCFLSSHGPPHIYQGMQATFTVA